MNRKKGIRILLTVLTVAALLAAGGYALWKNGFFEKINSVEALREVIAGTGMWAGGVYFALQMMTVIIAPIPSNISTVSYTHLVEIALIKFCALALHKRRLIPDQAQPCQIG